MSVETMSNAGTVWWEQIGNSLRLLARVTAHLRDGRSAVLAFPSNLPWRERFYEEIDVRRAGFSMDRRLKRLAWEGGSAPGDFVLRKLCPPNVRAAYWPGQTYAAYLGSKADLLLCDSDVWITDIHGKEDLSAWTAFVSEYEQAAKELDRRAVFLLEYDGPETRCAPLDAIPCPIEAYDCRVFCLEMAADMSDQALRGYRAELALCIGNGIPELCAALLESGEGLMADPLSAALDAAETARSRGLPSWTESEINSAVWRAQVVLLFPVLERRHFDFISQYREVLAGCLPISNSNGEQVVEPFDLEIGALPYIINHAGYTFLPKEVEEIHLCRKVRNQLAHNQPASYEDVKAVLAMEAK